MTEEPCEAGMGQEIVPRPWLWGRDSQIGSDLCKASSLLVAGPACSSGLLVLAGWTLPHLLLRPWTEGSAACALQGGRFHSRWASCLRHRLLGTLEFFWFEKVECDFMEIGPEVVINLADMGYVQ